MNIIFKVREISRAILLELQCLLTKYNLLYNLNSTHLFYFTCIRIINITKEYNMRAKHMILFDITDGYYNLTE